MATNLPQNESYASAIRQSIVPTNQLQNAVKALASRPATGSGFRYNQRIDYSKLNNPLPLPTPTAAKGTPEYDQEYFNARQVGINQYGNLINSGKGIPSQTQFYPPDPSKDINAPIPIPSDYGSFAEPMSFTENGQKLSWGTPERPVIRNIQGDVPGQYVEDQANPELLVKTKRGVNSIADNAIRAGRPGFLSVIDHVMPLALGGADTLENRQLLTPSQNYQKTKAQAIPYTLYAYGDISKREAQEMAMSWMNRDLTDIPKPNDIGLVSDTDGKTGIEIAREARERWKQPKKPTIKEKIGAIPDRAKNFGEGWLPDSVREFVKGFGSSASLGFIPYEQDDNESKGAWLAGKAGQIAGGVASFIPALRLVGLAAKAGKVITTYKSAATAKALSAGFKAPLSAGTMGPAGAGQWVASGADTTAKAAETTFKSLNKTPGYLRNLVTPETAQRALKFGAANVLVAQGHQFVANKFNPEILSGQQYQTDQENIIGNIFKDLAIGAAGGIMPMTLKGTAGAIMLPTTLTYLANPDDPLDAITNGVIFGALHGVSSYKRPGFNDVKMFGGKAYENPTTKAFEDTVNSAAYASLRHYAPGTMSGFKSTDRIPESIVQKARDEAIESVWKRVFFGKTDAPTAVDLKTFSRGLETDLSLNVPELKGFSRLSLSARKERTSKVKEQEANISREYGKEYQSRNKFKKEIETPDDALDLQAALTEIKRITVASRQLYKGGLSREMRDKADIDDLLSFSKENLQGRFNEQERFINPPIVKQAVDLMDESFMQKSFNNDAINLKTPYINGTIDIPGLALAKNSPKYKYLFDDNGNLLPNVSPNMILVARPDTAPLWSMKNKLLTTEDINSGNHAVDLHPENAIQAFFIVKNPQTGAKEIIEGGFVASTHHLGKINSHPGVKEYVATNGEKGMKPIDFDKEQVMAAMKKADLSYLVVNIDRIATGKTYETSNPFIVVNTRDNNFIYSKKMGDRLSQQENRNPISMDIAKVNSAAGAKQKAEAIAVMNKKIVKPAADYLPKQVTLVNPKTDRVTEHQETTRQTLQTLEKSLDVASPIQVKESFKRNFGMILDDATAETVFNRRNDLTVREGVKLLVDAANKGDASILTKLNTQFVTTYLRSGALQFSEGGKAVLDMPIVGKIKQPQFAQPKPSSTGQAELFTKTEPVTASDIHNLADSKKIPWDNNKAFMEKTKSLTGKEHLDDLTQSELKVVRDDLANIPSTVTPVSIIPEPAGGSLANRVTSTFKSENGPVVSRKATQAEMNRKSNQVSITALAKDFLPEARAAIENAKDGYIGDVIKSHKNAFPDIEKLIQSSLQKKGVSPKVIKQVKDYVETEMEKISSSIIGPPIKKVEGDFNPMYEKPADVMKPAFVAREFYKNIDDNIAKKEPASHFFGKGFDMVLSKIIGPEYRKDKDLPRVLDDYFKNIFFNDINAAGKEITQKKDIFQARAIGSRNLEDVAMNERNKQVVKKIGEEGDLSAAERRQRGFNPTDNAIGITPEEMKSGIRVADRYQEDNMVRDLTQGEDMMAAIFSDIPSSGITSVRAIKNLFTGTSGYTGLREFLLKNHPKAKPVSVPFNKLEQDALAADASHAIKINAEKTKQIAAAKAMNDLPKLKEKLETLLKVDPEDPDPAWLTTLKPGMIKEIKDNIEKYSKLIEETKPDGSGGPGIHKWKNLQY